MNLKTLVLNREYLPISLWPLSVADPRDVIRVFFKGRAEIIHTYARQILTPSRDDLYWPSVAVIPNSRTMQSLGLRPQTLWTREEGACYYCGNPITLKDLTRDHYIPKSKGGSSGWTNIVASCMECNLRKGNSMPEGDWVGKGKPKEPNYYDLLKKRSKLPIVIDDPFWSQFLPGFADVTLRGNDDYRRDY